jgi:hypothetical protein
MARTKKEVRDIVAQRLNRQLLAGNALATAEEVVAHFGAIQAQDYLGSLWAIGLRTTDATEADIERAVQERRIVRCWPMRGTLHFVAATDVRWMLDFLAPRILRRHRIRLERDFELDNRTMKRARTILERALRGGRVVTRAAIYELLNEGGIRTNASRGLHILFTLSLEQFVCFGPRLGKQPAFVLYDEWLPATNPKTADEALVELTRRYVGSHGPASPADFAWWSGVTMREAKEGFAIVGDGAPIDQAARSKTTVHLLPTFDEYTVAYKDRDAVLASDHARHVYVGGGMIHAIVVVNGVVAGGWKRKVTSRGIELTVSNFRELNARERSALKREIARYAAFVGAKVVLKGLRDED